MALDVGGHVGPEGVPGDAAEVEVLLGVRERALHGPEAVADRAVDVQVAPEPARRHAYTPEKTENPPSMGTTAPVTKRLASLSSQSSAPSSSSGSPKRPMGVLSMIA